MKYRSSAIVIGAGGAIGSALYKHWQEDNNIDSVFVISRQELTSSNKNTSHATHYIRCDYSETSIEHAYEVIKILTDGVSRICICNGILHNDTIWPEKRIEDLNLKTLQDIFAINSFIPILWLKALLPLAIGNTPCVIAVFNARIGSIGDNRSGGWYSYRASKAALNMLLKTASIEYARRAKNVKIISFHPGTTDTNLSKPFQGSVNPIDLLSSDTVAESLINIMNNQTIDGQLDYIDWENKPIVW